MDEREYTSGGWGGKQRTAIAAQGYCSRKRVGYTEGASSCKLDAAPDSCGTRSLPSPSHRVNVLVFRDSRVSLSRKLQTKPTTRLKKQKLFACRA